MRILPISVTAQGDGFNFSLKPAVRRELKAQFPSALFTPNVFVGDNGNRPFGEPGTLTESRMWLDHIVPVLTGLSVTDLSQQLTQVVFLDSSTGAFYLQFDCPREGADFKLVSLRSGEHAS